VIGVGALILGTVYALSEQRFQEGAFGEWSIPDHPFTFGETQDNPVIREALQTA
jgi:hypothetical protein